MKRREVWFGSKTDLTAAKSDFRSTPKIGLKSDIVHVGFVSTADMTRRQREPAITGLGSVKQPRLF
jgi:hypothetical protein